ncbi:MULTISPECIES: hypothetical protein [unclassified Wolbachia]|uniref:hypothetical protein n=1 Tax=unclassified Wolbachia TaxID=2640676 RepID=UPI003132A71B
MTDLTQKKQKARICSDAWLMYNTEIKIPVLPFLSSQCLTLGWLCCITLYEMVIYGKFM